MPFEFFDHTGDIGVNLRADSLAGLFEAASEAFTAALCDLDRVEPRLTETVALGSPAPDRLLVDWLTELLYRFEVRELLVRSAQVTITAGEGRCDLGAILRGERLDLARHAIKVLVKGVTYHGLTVTQSGDGWEARVILDI